MVFRMRPFAVALAAIVVGGGAVYAERAVPEEKGSQMARTETGGGCISPAPGNLSSATTEALRPAIVPRTKWADREPLTERLTEHGRAIRGICLHHSGVDYADDRNPSERHRGLLKFSLDDRPWGDVPYHYIIDLEGRVYEARAEKWAGDTNTQYDPAGYILIEMMGNYETREVRAEQSEALAGLCAWLAARYGLTGQDITSHKELAPGQTVCPGKNVQALLDGGSLRRKVDAALGRMSPDRAGED